MVHDVMISVKTFKIMCTSNNGKVLRITSHLFSNKCHFGSEQLFWSSQIVLKVKNKNEWIAGEKCNICLLKGTTRHVSMILTCLFNGKQFVKGSYTCWASLFNIHLHWQARYGPMTKWWIENKLLHFPTCHVPQNTLL